MKSIIYIGLIVCLISCNNGRTGTNAEIIKFHKNGIPSKIKLLKDSTFSIFQYYDNGVLKSIDEFKNDSIRFGTSVWYDKYPRYLHEVKWKNGKANQQKIYFGDGLYYTVYKDNGEIDSTKVDLWNFENTSLAHSIAFKDTVKVGETYTAKLFLKNRNVVYSNSNLIPQMKFINGESSWENVLNHGKEVLVKNDTGIVSIIAENKDLKGRFTVKKWNAAITIHLPHRDTTFLLTRLYVIEKE